MKKSKFTEEQIVRILEEVEVGSRFFGDFSNAGKSTVNGLEIEYQWLPTKNWLISGNLVWLGAKYDESISAGANVADSQYFTNAAEFSGALNGEYRMDLANGGNLSARVGYSYQSEVWPTTDLSPVIGRMVTAWSARV